MPTIDDGALARFFAGPPLPFIAAFSHGVSGSCAVHQHDGLEIVFHRRGGGRTAAAGEDIAYADGSVVIYPARAPHDQRCDGPGEDVCLHLRASRPLPRALRRMLYVPRLPQPWLARELAAMADEPAPPDAASAAAWSHRGTAVLAAFAAAASHGVAPTQDPRMAAARDYIAARLRDPVPLAEIARHVGLSAEHLRHRFARVHGLGVVAYTRTLRVARAKELLAHAPIPLAEVARQCGFGSDRYLSTVFRRATGMTPGEYRASCRLPPRVDGSATRGTRASAGA
jgi:AraC-like DNA-binding protein